jgi:hypothetical protein
MDTTEIITLGLSHILFMGAEISHISYYQSKAMVF